jgi:hypothetical protein
MGLMNTYLEKRDFYQFYPALNDTLNPLDCVKNTFFDEYVLALDKSYEAKDYPQ